MRLPHQPDPDALARAEHLELPFNRHGIDRYGVSRFEVARFMTWLGWLYHHYFDAQVFGIDHVPKRGRVMLVGNHSGGVALDGAMILASIFYEMDPPRLAQGMAEKFLNRLPVASTMLSRVGQFTGLPEHAERLLKDDRMLLVFPEGARGTAKLFPERDSLVRFGTGFMRLARLTQTPIVPVAFVGGGEAIPTVANLYRLGRAVGMPYIPVTPWLLPLPRPGSFQLLFGKPLDFGGGGDASDGEIRRDVELVKQHIRDLIHQGRQLRQGKRSADDIEFP